MAACPEANLKACTCTYEPCPRRGHCCACVTYHRGKGEVPGCLFTTAGEATWDRSVAAFCRDHARP